MSVAATFLAALALLWAAMNAAGTVWSIPYAVALVVGALIVLRRTA